MDFRWEEGCRDEQAGGQAGRWAGRILDLRESSQMDARVCERTSKLVSKQRWACRDGGHLARGHQAGGRCGWATDG